MITMRHHIDLRRMRYVLEVARSQAITTAAETLGVTQSALSRSIAEVEDALGVVLFDRLPRGIRLTEAGKRFVDGAQRVLGVVDDLVTHVREPQALLGGRLRVGVAPSGYVDHSARALRDFAREHPGVGIDVVTGSTQALCPRLISGDFDLIVGSSSYLKRWRELDLEPVARMHFACMVRFDHPLATRNEPLREYDVLQYPFVMPRSVEPTYSDMAQRFAAHGLPPFSPHYAVDDFNVILRIVRHTDAIYPLMSPYSDFGGAGNHAALLQDAIEYPEHHITLAYAAGRPRGAAAVRFAELLRTHLAAAV